MVTLPGRSLSLRGKKGSCLDQIQLSAHPAVQEAVSDLRRKGVPTDVLWPSSPEVWSDVSSPATVRYREPAELAGLVSQAYPHAYVLGSADLHVLLAGLRQPPVGGAVTPVVSYGTTILVGPTFTHRPWPCVACWRERLTANTPSLRMRVARRHTIRSTTDPGMTLSLARPLWEAPNPSHRPSDVLVIDLARGAVTHEPVLPVPGCSCRPGPQEMTLQESAGTWVGAVKLAALSHTGIGGMVAADARSSSHPRLGGTSCDTDPRLARDRAIGETIERLSAGLGGQLLAARQVKGRDLPEPVRGYAPYSAVQYSSADFSYAGVEEAGDYLCFPALRLSDSSPSSLPAQLCMLQRLPGEPQIVPRSSTGTALAENRQEARLRALFELCERDLVTRHWFMGDAHELASPEEWLSRTHVSALQDWYIRAAVITPSLALCPTVVTYIAPTRNSPGALGTATDLTMASAVDHSLRDAVVMYRHLAADSALLEFADAWPHSLELRAVPWTTTGSLPRLVKVYDPLEVDLTTNEAERAGRVVVGVWSPHAIDFPRPAEPLQLGLMPELTGVKAPHIFTGRY
ncbi:YcaO-like family protein [Streptomyces sp. NPDC088775]|uniref:YcaO-like family protein n=1 Tax=Streptomyces sp. NPDC088775 TaxID=3365896 RepID=UPI003805106A